MLKGTANSAETRLVLVVELPDHADHRLIGLVFHRLLLRFHQRSEEVTRPILFRGFWIDNFDRRGFRFCFVCRVTALLLRFGADQFDEVTVGVFVDAQEAVTGDFDEAFAERHRAVGDHAHVGDGDVFD